MGKNNVNPDHYKTRGRERQGDDIVQEIHQQKYAQAKAEERSSGEPNFIPGAAPVGERPDDGSAEDKLNGEGKRATGQVKESANSSSGD